MFYFLAWCVILGMLWIRVSSTCQQVEVDAKEMGDAFIQGNGIWYFHKRCYHDFDNNIKIDMVSSE